MRDISKFFSVLNAYNGKSQINDESISTESTYSSFEINKLLNDIAGMLMGCNFLEYAPDIRASPQKVFETPNSNGAIMWVLREGVKMSLGIDYNIKDDTHIDFVEEVSEKYTVSILVIGKTNNTGTGEIIPNNSSVPVVFLQSTPTTSWNLKHDRGFKYPRLAVLDDQDNLVTDCVLIKYVDDNNLTISTDVPFQGKCIIYP